ncbi:MAG: M64 family metallopeptidase [Dysgonamonadaceae bacterium]|jgi:hypothetical protein|nr:M64 family metallopeptidase [Dysgonamonadaceae bacterium]
MKLFYLLTVMAICVACNVAPDEETPAGTDFYADGESLVLNKHSKGNGIPVVIIGDGFNHEDLRHGGNWEQVVTFVNNIFSQLEVFKDFKEYFDVYAYMAESQDRSVAAGSNTKFGTNGSLSNINFALAKTLIGKMPQIDDITKVSVMFICNGNIGGIGTAILEDDGYGYAVYSSSEPNAKYWCAHEFGGHVFGWVIDEIGGSGTITAASVDKLNHYQALGKYLNVAQTNDPDKAPWKHFLGVPGYDKVGLFEGGYYYDKGIWRSENTSIMVNQNYPHYNAQSRYLIYSRIKTLAGEPFTFEDFLDYDTKNLFQ